MVLQIKVSLNLCYRCVLYNPMLNKLVNILMAQFGTISFSMLLKLFNQFCCSLYGIT